MHYHDKKMSKKLSWLLRHGAGEMGLEMDPAGWVDVHAVLKCLRLSAHDLEAIVDTNPKRRLELRDGRIRACQGHSLDNQAVTQDGLEQSWASFTGSRIWHGTHVDAAFVIAREGIEARQRTHVHCAPTPDSSVGKRANIAVLLRIDVERLRQHGFPVFAAPNGVILVRYVPTSCIDEVTPFTARARESMKALRQAFFNAP